MCAHQQAANMADGREEVEHMIVDGQEEEKSLTEKLNKTLLESFLKRINSDESNLPQFECNTDQLQDDKQWDCNEEQENNVQENKQNGTL